MQRNDSPPTGQEETNMPSPAAVISSLSPFFHSSSPSNVLKGLVSGLGAVSMSVTGSLVLVVGLPIKATQLGYVNYGYCGAVGGALGGSVAGGVGAAAVTLFGLCSCLYSVSLGLYRTPFAIHAAANGKSWDDDAKEWFSYDLKVESNNLLNLADADFVNALKVPGATSADFFKKSNEQCGPMLLQNMPTEEDESGTEAQKKPAKKTVLDRELYDTLGVEPEASPNEIKKAYYLKARSCHPDRHPDDPEAKASFQKVGDAYQILADPKLRMSYDSKGKPAVEGQKTFDAAMIYTIIFGSEDFEHIIGELEIATQIKTLNSDGSQGELFRFKQRKRELQCAVLLANKLDVLAVEGDGEQLIDKARNEAKALAETKLGCTLLGVIGSIYCDRASAKLSSISYLSAKMNRAKGSIQHTISCISYTLGTFYGAYRINEVKKAADDRQKEEDRIHGVSEDERTQLNAADQAMMGPLALKQLYGPNPTDEHKAVVRNTTKLLSSNIFGLLWEVTKADITTTLTHVCRKVLRDHSVSDGTRVKRATALLLLGQEYCRVSVKEEEGIAEFINKMGSQSGLFGPESNSAGGEEGEEGEDTTQAEEREERETGSSSSSSSSSEEEEVWDREKIQQVLNDINILTVKQLKEAITVFGGDYSDCIEKEEMRSRLSSLLLERCAEKDETKHGNEKKMD